MRNADFYLLLVCFFLGVALAEIFHTGLYFSLLPLLVGLVFLSLSFLGGFSRWFLLISFCFLIFGAGACRLSSLQPSANYFLPEIGERQTFRLAVKSDLDRREFSDRALADIISAGGKDLKEKDRVLLILPKGSGAFYKDILFVSGELAEPEPFLGTGGILFDYPWYLKKDGVSLMLKVKEVEKLEKYEYFSPLKYLYGFKSVLLSKMETILPYPESGLLSGILLGEKGNLSPELRAELTSSGLIHIAVLSGYNVAVVAALFLFLLRSFSPVARFSIATASILVLILMTGADSAGVRAGIMGFLLLLGGYLGRVSDAGRLLSVAGLVMVFWNPFLLLHDPGFQLSFIATAGLIFLTPMIQAVFSKFWPRLPAFLSGLVATTLGAQIFVTPLLLYQMGVFSLYSLPANLLVLPLVPVSMFLGAGAVLTSFLSPLAATPIAYTAYAFLYYAESVAGLAAGLPAALLRAGSVPLPALLAAYVLLFIGVYFLNRFFAPSLSALPERSN